MVRPDQHSARRHARLKPGLAHRAQLVTNAPGMRSRRALALASASTGLQRQARVGFFEFELAVGGGTEGAQHVALKLLHRLYQRV